MSTEQKIKNKYGERGQPWRMPDPCIVHVGVNEIAFNPERGINANILYNVAVFGWKSAGTGAE